MFGFRCQNCGAVIDVHDGEETVVCSYCKSVFKVPQTTHSSISKLLERAYLLLEDGDFARADEYLEKVLDIEPKNAKAYVGKLMVLHEVQEEEELGLLTERLNCDSYFKKVCRFGDTECKERLIAYDLANKNRIDSYIYEAAKKAMNCGDYLRAAELFSQVRGLNDADKLYKLCSKKLLRKHRAHNTKFLIAGIIITGCITFFTFKVFEQYVQDYWYILLLIDVLVLFIILRALKKTIG